MKASFLIALFAVATLPGIPAAIASPVDSCDLGTTKTIGELQYKLSRRAVEAVIRVAETGNDGGDRLRQLVTPMASFSLGSGDVSIPLGSGIAGLRVLVREMRADTFRFFGWDYVPTPVTDPCGPNKVKIEFTDTRSRRVFSVTFTFQAGRIVAAEGWSHSLVTGPIPPVH